MEWGKPVREGSQGAHRGNSGMEWRRGGRGGTLETKFPQSSTPPPCASGSEALSPSAMDRYSGHLFFGDWLREWEEKLRQKQRVEEEEVVLREKRERRKKQQRDKKELGEKKRRQKKELRGIRWSAVSISDGIGVEAGEVSSNELCPAIEDTPRLERLSLNDSPSALDSIIGDMRSGLPDPTIMASSSEKSLSPRSVELREFEEYLKEHTFDTGKAAYKRAKMVRPFPDPTQVGATCTELLLFSDKAARAKDQAVYQQPSLDKFESQRVLEPNQDRPVLVPEEGRSVATQGQYSEGSKEEIAQNAKKWMVEEVMVAFQKYSERKDDPKECDYKLDELCNQCFNVGNYNHIFHHFNFSIKMKTAGLTDWISVLYFAEVKEILGRDKGRVLVLYNA